MLKKALRKMQKWNCSCKKKPMAMSSHDKNVKVESNIIYFELEHQILTKATNKSPRCSIDKG